MEQAEKTKILDSIKEVGHRKFLTSCAKSERKTLNKTGLPIHWVTALFEKFQARYLSKWTTALEGIENTAVVEWSQALSGLTGEQIKNGLDSLTDEWPPSAPAFRALCEGKGINGFGLNYLPECYREIKRERLIESDENKAAHKAAYQSGMAGLREKLK